jgi:hypothetical protein
MRIFLWGLILTIILLIGVAHIATPFLRHKQIYHALPIHKTLYLDRNIDDDELFHIMQAAMEWKHATNGQVVLDIKRLPRPYIPLTNAIIVINVSPEYPDILMLDNGKGPNTLGYCNSAASIEFIELVNDRMNEENSTSVVLHELGHALGLEHTAEVGTLMYPVYDEGSNHITSSDLKQFCKLYHCDPSKFHGDP